MTRPGTVQGTTLLELLVVLVLMAIMLALIPGAFPRTAGGGIGGSEDAARTAILSGHPTSWVDSAGRRYLFLPDGRQVADPERIVR